MSKSIIFSHNYSVSVGAVDHSVSVGAVDYSVSVGAVDYSVSVGAVDFHRSLIGILQQLHLEFLSLIFII